MAELVMEGAAPFDFIFIDADKPGYPAYLTLALKLTRPGSLIVADNMVRKGKVADAKSRDEAVQGARKFNALIAKNPRLEATAVQTVGSKGYDGCVLARVIS
jgi:predicted O-methyltransferase YrrM